jgi:hypothetical protein
MILEKNRSFGWVEQVKMELEHGDNRLLNTQRKWCLHKEGPSITYGINLYNYPASTKQRSCDFVSLHKPCSCVHEDPENWQTTISKHDSESGSYSQQVRAGQKSHFLFVDIDYSVFININSSTIYLFYVYWVAVSMYIHRTIVVAQHKNNYARSLHLVDFSEISSPPV